MLMRYPGHLKSDPADSPEGSCEFVKWRQVVKSLSNGEESN